MSKSKTIKGSFISVWDDGSVITTSCKLDPSSGEIFPEMSDDDSDHGSLEREYFESSDGDEFEVCTTCHGFILKSEMVSGIGHDLNEEQVCSDPDCVSHE